MPAKKTAKKAAAVKKAVTKRTPKEKVVYVVSKRSKMFLWNPVAAFQNAPAAKSFADRSNIPYTIDMFKVTSVKLDA